MIGQRSTLKKKRTTAFWQQTNAMKHKQVIANLMGQDFATILSHENYENSRQTRFYRKCGFIHFTPYKGSTCKIAVVIEKWQVIHFFFGGKQSRNLSCRHGSVRFLSCLTSPYLSGLWPTGRFFQLHQQLPVLCYCRLTSSRTPSLSWFTPVFSPLAAFTAFFYAHFFTASSPPPHTLSHRSPSVLFFFFNLKNHCMAPTGTARRGCYFFGLFVPVSVLWRKAVFSRWLVPFKWAIISTAWTKDITKAHWGL